MGCDGLRTPGIVYCYEAVNEQLSSYLKTYFGLIVTSIVCQVCSHMSLITYTRITIVYIRRALLNKILISDHGGALIKKDLQAKQMYVD